MVARLLKWMITAVLMFGTAGTAGAETLEEICAKGGLAVPPPPWTQLGGPQQARSGLYGLPGAPSQCLTLIGLGATPELSATDDKEVYKCLCYASYLNQHAQSEAKKQEFSGFITKLRNLLSTPQTTQPTPTPGGPVSCAITATPDAIKIPSRQQKVTVIATLPAGTPSVTFKTSRADITGNAEKPGTQDPSNPTTFTATYTYFSFETDEKENELRYFLTNPACTKTAIVKLERGVLKASLSAQPNPLAIDPGATAKLTLGLSGVGDVTWTVLADGIEQGVSGSSPDREGDRIIPIALNLSRGAQVSVRVSDPSGQTTTTNPIRVYIKPRAKTPPLKGACNTDKTAVQVTFNVDNPDGLELEIRARIVSRETQKNSGLITQKSTGNSISRSINLPSRKPGGDRYALEVWVYYSAGPGHQELLFRRGEENPVEFKIQFPSNLQNAFRNAEQEPVVEDCELCECILGIPDADGDGIEDADDNCPDQSNADQADTDEDGVGNVCDNCLEQPNFEQADSDNDGAGDVCDSCPETENPGGADGDDDGIGNACDNCPSLSNPEQDDTDGDAVGDICDNCPEVSNPDQADDDQDGIGNACIEDVGCAPTECCPEFPEPCGDNCYEPCPEGYEVDPADCAICIEVADLNPPAVEIQVPASGSTVPAGATIQVTTVFSDAGERDSGVVSGAFSVAGSAVASGAVPAGFDIVAISQRTQLFSFVVKSDLTGITDRNIIITAQGSDAAGNRSAVATAKVVAGGVGLSLLLSVSPPDPGPEQDVTVTITVTNCDPTSTQVKYTVAGTDGYGDANTLGVDSSCQSSFGIPGGQAGVVDVVTVEIVGTGISQTVSYAF